MNRSNWFQCKDISQMLDYLWSSHSEEELTPVIHEFYLKCARNIQILLPQEESVRGIEFGERYLLGKINNERLSKENWAVEGAAFCIDYDTEPKKITEWVNDINNLNSSELEKILFAVDVSVLDARELLKDAAYFADYAMIFPACRPKNTISDSYVKFLSPDILRGIINDPEKMPNK